jgi:hypothetical protein
MAGLPGLVWQYDPFPIPQRDLEEQLRLWSWLQRVSRAVVCRTGAHASGVPLLGKILAGTKSYYQGFQWLTFLNWDILTVHTNQGGGILWRGIVCRGWDQKGVGTWLVCPTTFAGALQGFKVCCVSRKMVGCLGFDMPLATRVFRSRQDVHACIISSGFPGTFFYCFALMYDN